MSKFQKRIAKNAKKSPMQCLVVGNGFDMFDEILEMFDTVFILESSIEKKTKNLIQRQNVEATFDLLHLTTIFVDLDKIHLIEKLSPIITKTHPDIFIEGDEVLPRETNANKFLYKVGYNAMAKLGWCHQWSSL